MSTPQSLFQKTTPQSIAKFPNELKLTNSNIQHCQTSKTPERRESDVSIDEKSNATSVQSKMSVPSGKMISQKRNSGSNPK